MKKLSTILFTICIILVSFSKTFGACEDYHSSNVYGGTLRVDYIYGGGGVGYAESNSNSVLTPNDTETLSSITKQLTLGFDGDYAYIHTTVEIMCVANSTYDDNVNCPLPNNLSAPILSNYNNTYSSVCEIMDSSVTSHFGQYLTEDSPSAGSVLPSLTNYNILLKCYKNENYYDFDSQYSLYFPLNFNTFSSNGYNLQDPYRINVFIDEKAIISDDICSSTDISSIVQDLSDSIEDINSTITDTSTSNSQTELESQLDDWGVNYHGVAGFVTAPLSFISSLANQQACTPIPLPPLLGNTSTFVLPCIMEEFEDRFPSLFTIYQIAIYFFVCYRIGIDCFKLIQKLKDPLNDEISVADI